MMDEHKLQHAVMVEHLSGEGLQQIIYEACQKAIEVLRQEYEDKLSKDYQLMTRHEVADMFNISLVTVQKWSEKGEICPIYFGGRVYFKRADIIARCEEQSKRQLNTHMLGYR